MAATGKVLGTVTSVVGEAKATAADGTVRILQVGDVVHSDEVITTSAAGAINVALENGKSLDCGANTDLSLHEGILGISTAQSNVPSVPGTPGAPAASGSDVDALQKAIASGQDPTQIAPATAAGGAPAAGGAGGDGSGGTPVVIEQANSSSPITAGIGTEGGSITFPTPEFQLLKPTEQPTVSVSVQVEVEVGVEPGQTPPGGGTVPTNPVVSTDAVGIIEGTGGETPRTVNFIIKLSQAFDTDVQVTYQIQPGPANAAAHADAAQTPSDYTGVLTATITIPAGETQFVVPVQIVQDHIVENNENFSIVLTDAQNATIDPAHNSAVVTILDDDTAPVAHADTNWTQEDVQVVATGNVIAGQAHGGAPSGSFADLQDTDADGDVPHVTTTGTFNGTYGTLTLNADGTYTYTLNNGSAAVQALDTGETLQDSFNYTASDGFNAPSSSTLTVTIFGSNDVPEIQVRTDPPGGGTPGPFADSAQGVVDEAALSTGSNPSSNAEFATGALRLADADGLDDIKSVTVNGTTVSIDNLVGSVFHGSAGDMTITSYSNGIANFSYELKHAVTDVPNQAETDVFTMSTSDGTASSGNATVTITIIDDVPSISVAATQAADALVVDETNLNANATANFADNFTSTAHFNADGAGSVSSAYTLSINAGSTGLMDTATGQAVSLQMSAGKVQGVITGGVVVFEVSVDASGNVTLDQQRAVVHSDTTNPDDAKSLASANLVVLTRTDTITDSDGDSANSSASINLGNALTFKDDGPSITVSATQPADNLTVDETNLSVNASANFADNFSSSSSFGADGAGSVSSGYALSIKSNGANSGLVDSGTNQAVTLTMNGSTVEGHVSNGEGGFFVVFTVSVDAGGTVTLDQQRAVMHTPNTGPDQSTTLSASDLVVLTRTDTITDKDGDSASSSAQIQIGTALTFKDDAPSITVSRADVSPDPLVVDETNLNVNATANFADNFTNTPSFGADGAGSVSSGYTLSINSGSTGLVDTASGQAVTLQMSAGKVQGVISGGAVVFEVSVDASGNVTLDQQRAVVHSNTSNPDDSTGISSNLIILTRTDTITDKDGDTAQGSASLDIGSAMTFKDDGPSISVSVVQGADNLTVDETFLSVNASANFADNFSNSPAFGADGAGSVTSAYALSIKSNGADSGLVDTATNQAVTLTMNGGVVEGHVSNGEGGFFVVFTVSVDAGGTVTLDQQRAVVHTPNTGPDQSTSLNAADLIVLTRTDTITDKDGDSSQGSASINIGTALTFKDDAPSVTVSATQPADALTVDETNLAVNATANYADNFSNTPNFGADGAGSVSTAFSLSVKSAGVASGLTDTATQQSVVLTVNGSGVVEGRTSGSGDLVFTVSVNGAGTVTLDQQRAVMHTPDSGPDQPTSLSAADLIVLTRTDTITDKDGDSSQGSASINIGTALTFKDDAPSLSITGGDSSVIEGQSITNGTWTSASGADAPATTKVVIGSTEYDLGTGIDTGKGTLTVNSNGTWTFAAALNQTNPATVTFTVKITDQDGDAASASQTITINDGANPSVSGPQVITVNEAALSDGSNPASTAETGTAGLVFTSGSDNIASIKFGSTAGITVSGLETVPSQAIVWSADASGHTLTGTVGGTPVIQVVLSGDLTVAAGGNTGNVTVTATLLDNLLNQDSPNATSAVISGITVVGTDTDGDTATQTFTGITVVDDVPSFPIANDADGNGVVSISAPNLASNTTYTSQFADWQYGADAAAGTPTLSGVTGNATVNAASNANTMVIDLKDGSGTLAGQLTLNANGTDSLMVVHRDPAILTDVLLTSDVTAGGPALSKTINSSISGLVITVTATDGGAADLVNPSTQGWAVSDNQVDLNEAILFSFNQAVQQFSFVTNGFTGNPSNGDVGVTIRVFYDAGHTVFQDFTVNMTSGQSTQVANLANFGHGSDNNTYTQFFGVNVLSNNTNDSNDGFRLNNVTVSKLSSTPPPDLDYSFTMNVTDKDGDVTAKSFTVHLDGDTTTGSLVTEGIAGTSGADSLLGTAANDVLFPGGGHDTMDGGLGVDTFKFSGPLDANSSDTILNFAAGPGGDVLDLHDVLPAAAQGQTTEGALMAFINVQSVGGNTVVSIDADGAGAGAPVQVVTLQGVTATLADLLTNHQIHT